MQLLKLFLVTLFLSDVGDFFFTTESVAMLSCSKIVSSDFGKVYV